MTKKRKLLLFGLCSMIALYIAITCFLDKNITVWQDLRPFSIGLNVFRIEIEQFDDLTISDDSSDDYHQIVCNVSDCLDLVETFKKSSKLNMDKEKTFGGFVNEQSNPNNLVLVQNPGGDWYDVTIVILEPENCKLYIYRAKS
jgi:hypothetical protein